MKINFLKKSFKFTTLIVLSTNIFACSQLKDKQAIQPKIERSETTLTAINSIEEPTWNNIDIKTITGHTDGIWSVAINPQQSLIATASEDNTIKLWSSKYINSVAFNSDGTILVSTDEDTTIKLWDVNEGKVIRTLSGSSAGVNSAIFVNGDRTIISGSAAGDNKLRIWQESN
jgi:WD40 repeat protein